MTPLYVEITEYRAMGSGRKSGVYCYLIVACGSVEMLLRVAKHAITIFSHKDVHPRGADEIKYGWTYEFLVKRKMAEHVRETLEAYAKQVEEEILQRTCIPAE